MNYKSAFLLTGLAGATFAFQVSPAQAAGYNDDYCREYTKSVTVGGRVVESYGTACLQPDGAWRIRGTNERISAPPTVARERVTYAAPRTAYRAPTNLVVVREPVYYTRISTRDYVWGHPRYHGHGQYKYYKNGKHYKNVKYDKR